MDEAPPTAPRPTAKVPPQGQMRHAQSAWERFPSFWAFAFDRSLWSSEFAWRLSSRGHSQVLALRGQRAPNDGADVGGELEQVGLHSLVHPFGAGLEGEVALCARLQHGQGMI